ncbi:MAG: hypothetical protein HUJ61_06825, partial [Bacilli bacterium]|nr:hypothetical protein [Bacilli bacterium]
MAKITTHYEINNAKFSSPIKEKKSKKNLIFTLISLLFNAIIIAYVAYSAYEECRSGLNPGEKFDITLLTGEVFATWKHNSTYIWGAIGCFLASILAEVLKIYIIV